MRVLVPTVSEVNKYLQEWSGLDNYTAQESALNKLFNLLLPENKELDDILLKVSCLNDFYSTNIFAIYPVANHILNIPNLDKRLQNGDITLVNEISQIEISGKIKNFYSFATKYCSHHNPFHFPIYDSYVEKMLLFFNNTHQFANFQKTDLKKYDQFKAILLSFQKHFKLAQFSLKEIDRYLWLLGKETFPRK